jgi:hypothetical protein
MSAPSTTDESRPEQLTLVIRAVSDLTTDLANAIYDGVDGECEIAMRSGLLYIELGGGDVDIWAATPRLVAAVQRIVPGAELVRVEVADMETAAERAQQPLRSSA